MNLPHWPAGSVTALICAKGLGQGLTHKALCDDDMTMTTMVRDHHVPLRICLMSLSLQQLEKPHLIHPFSYHRQSQGLGHGGGGGVSSSHAWMNE